jgi:hypothetical protein
VGSICHELKSCAVGQYCQVSELVETFNAICLPEIKVGRSCNLTNEEFSSITVDSCEWGSWCSAVHTESMIGLCMKLLSLPDGKELPIRHDGYVEKAFCRSNNKLEVNDKYYCMPSNRSVSHHDVPVAKGTKCYYRFHDDVSNPSHSLIMTDEATCGYNQESGAYCNQRMGDKAYQKYLKELKYLFAKPILCHKTYVHDSPLDIDGFCKVITDKYGFQFLRDMWLDAFIINPGFNAKVANNAQCVKETLTFFYWGIDSASLLQATGVLLSLALLI